jgi:hypothetical protein
MTTKGDPLTSKALDLGETVGWTYPLTWQCVENGGERRNLRTIKFTPRFVTTEDGTVTIIKPISYSWPENWEMVIKRS